MTSKTFLALCFFLFTGWTDSGTETEYAEIHIFRPKQFQGGAVIFQAQANDKTFGHLSNGSKLIYRVFNEGAIELKLKASVFTSKKVSFGVLKGQKYYIKAGYGDGFGSKLSFVQLPESEGKQQFENPALFHRKKVKLIDENPEMSAVVNEDVFSIGLEKIEEIEGNKPSLGWISPAKANFKTDVNTFSLQLCLTSDAKKMSLKVDVNSTSYEELEDIITHDRKCSYTYISTLTLKPGANKIKVKLSDEFGMSFFTRTVYYEEPEELKYRGLALIIGNSNYLHTDNLSNPKNDAYDMRLAMRKLGFEVMKYDNLESDEMKRVIGNYLLKLDKYKTGVVFYAGHGVQHSGRNYLVPVDANLSNENDITSSCVDTGSILSKMELMDVETNIVILDACRSTPFEGLRVKESDSSAGLTGTDAPPGTIVAFATAPGRTASDGTGKNGLYTQEILNYIYKPDLKLEDLFKQVRVSVMKKSNNQQIPWETSSLVKDFYFYQQPN
ncbi:caspase family protein [Fulvivirga sp. M361]|uniref:caspase family protein n=1 Tax=Fulvivirga sp. M361 TaxID=2594266 RepID=UPI001179F427|nr:caspase family protein [Fulvivirga sp. M361]TRX62219.1 caspase family protein [Fulvivirga sp. M361]